MGFLPGLGHLLSQPIGLGLGLVPLGAESPGSLFLGVAGPPGIIRGLTRLQPGLGHLRGELLGALLGQGGALLHGFSAGAGGRCGLFGTRGPARQVGSLRGGLAQAGGRGPLAAQRLLSLLPPCGQLPFAVGAQVLQLGLRLIPGGVGLPHGPSRLLRRLPSGFLHRLLRLGLRTQNLGLGGLL